MSRKSKLIARIDSGLVEVKSKVSIVDRIMGVAVQCGPGPYTYIIPSITFRPSGAKILPVGSLVRGIDCSLLVEFPHIPFKQLCCLWEDMIRNEKK